MPISLLDASHLGDNLKLFSGPSSSEQQDRKRLAEQAKKLAQYEAQMTKFETRVAELEADSGCHNGVFIMKIANFTERVLPDARRGETTVIYSRPFYSHPQGYKFCLRVHPNGINQPNQPQPNGTAYMSLFIHLMRGEYDDVLEWPFRGRITLAVLDLHTSSSTSSSLSSTAIGTASANRHSSSKQQQQQQSLKKKDISACVQEIDPTLEAFQRPTQSRSRRGFGYVEFVSLSDLLTGTGGEPSLYLRQDALYIRATVESAKTSS